MSPGIYIHEDVELVTSMYSPLFDCDWTEVPIREHLEQHARTLETAHGDKQRAATVVISNWFPPLVGRAAVIPSTILTPDDYNLIVAREHGFGSWKTVDELDGLKPETLFELAVDCLVNGQIDDLRNLLQSRPELVSTRSRYGHSTTLLGYVAANGIETRRQQTPLNIVEIAQLLLDSGAAPDATIPVYGKNCSIVELIETSAHPHEAGVAKRLIELLTFRMHS